MVNKTLTIENDTGGTTDPAAGAHAYTQNSTVTVTAIPTNSNWAVDYWSINGGVALDVAKTTYSIYLNTDYTLKAWFIQRWCSERRHRVSGKRRRT
jgi:hypothetical protein